MKNRTALQRTIFTTAVIFLILYSHGMTNPHSRQGNGERIITDRAGERIKIPHSPEKIACLLGPSFEKVFMLGSADKVLCISTRQNAWAYHIYPRMKDIPVLRYYTEPDVEKLLTFKPDLLFYWYWPSPRKRLLAAGIPAVCPSRSEQRPETVQQFMKLYKEEIMFYGDLLGGQAPQRARDYCDYFDKCFNMILSRTKKIQSAERTRVYYATMSNELKSQGKYSTAYYLTELAGGELVSGGLDKHFVDTSVEQVIAWNPEMIIVGDPASRDRILSNHQWSTIKAVRQKKLTLCPTGVFHASHGSTEIVLLVQFLAKSLHPELFEDINLQKEYIWYYKKYFSYDLSGREAEMILHNLPPPGFDAGKMNFFEYKKRKKR
ncbi:MAG: hypothetical protein CVV44_16950 [Spirochaetae bacterium HGW-Spirochaetae-1]|jgi:iron complex transport system substrate-binding protein|nr:MAG: hypothetical protein CVV44_16950 [Spirochaetae bacterium HGW-Spirochaetae-1]